MYVDDNWAVTFWKKLKPLSHQTALPHRLYSVIKTCQRAVGSPRNTRKTPVTPEWRPYSVPTAFKKIAERRGARCANASNAVETLWKRCAIA